MTCHINNNIILYRVYPVSVILFVILLLCALFFCRSEAKAQGNTGGRKADFLFKKPKAETT